jgi:L-ribulose-5-phosphate 4-epimerase
MGRMGQAYFTYQGQELWRKRVRIMGGGAVGRRVVQRLLPFGASVLLYDPFVTEGEALLMGAQKVGLEALLAESHVITLHAPVTDDTRGLLNDAAFARMRDGAFLVNTARAALIDTPALLRALESGRLGGVALDVFDVEPPGADDPLLAFDMVIATPHIGGDTVEVGDHQGALVVEAVEQLLAGQAPVHVLNPETLARFSWTGARPVHAEELARLSREAGPGVRDLDVAPSPTAAMHREEERKGGLLRRLLGSRDNAAPGPARVTAGGDANRVGSAAGEGNVRIAYMRIIERFLDLLAQDRALAAGTVGKEVVFLYTLKELDTSFYMSFVDGVVEAGLGEPPREPHVRLKMDAATFDGLMLGTVNGMQAAMSGKLSFSGDTRRAMSMQRFQRGMGAAYQQARAELGDPGDLAKIGQSSAGTVPEATVAIAPPLAHAKTGDVRDEILQVVNELYGRGLITATGGNVSARSAENPDEIWITPSAIFKGDLRADMMVKIDLEGHQLSQSEYAASSERFVHCAIYRNRPEVGAVVHSHAPQATLMALAGVPFEPISADAAFLGEIPVVPFMMPGMPELGRAVAEALGREGLAVLMQNHGLVVVGTSPRRVADMTEVVERTAQALLGCRMLGVAPQLLPADVVEELRGMGKMLA